MKIFTLLLTAVFVPVSAFGQAAVDPIRVYVFSAPVTGFVDEVRPISDSVLDIQKILLETDDKSTGMFKRTKVPRRPNLLLVYSADSADVTLEVVSSGRVKSTDKETVPSIFFKDETITKDVESTVMALGTVLRVKEYSKEFSSKDKGAWRYLALDIVKQLDKWADANISKFQ